MSIHRSPALLLALPLLGAAASAPLAEAATTRWHDVTWSVTHDDGLALTGAAFAGQKILGAMAVPYFELNGARYELTDARRIAGPTLGEADGALTVLATYRVPVRGGDVDVTVYHSVIDEDAQYRDLGEVSSRVTFRGPAGDYAFFWRIDPDLRGAAGDRVQVFTEAGNRGYWAASEQEQVIDLGGRLEFSRFKVRLNDGPDYAHQTQLRLAPPSQGTATAYVVRAKDGEWEANPVALVDRERVQTVQTGELVNQPIEGSDLALWYRAALRGSEGTLGPRMFAAELAGRSAIVEIDRMESTQWPPATITLQGKTQSVATAFATGGITINKVVNDTVFPDKNKISQAELDAVMESNISLQAEMDTPTQWYSWFGVANTLNIPGVLGIMEDIDGYSSDTDYREGGFMLYDSIVSSLPLLEEAGYPPQDLGQYMLWTLTHETGHAYNQHHEDYWITDTSCFYNDSAIMGYSYDVVNHLFWDFGPNTDYSMTNDPDDYVRPGHGVDFIASSGAYPYNTTKKHRKDHHWTYEFSMANCQ
jgi:hypothetical protein